MTIAIIAISFSFIPFIVSSLTDIAIELGQQYRPGVDIETKTVVNDNFEIYSISLAFAKPRTT